MPRNPVEVGAGHLKSNSAVGGTRDVDYRVPPGATNVRIDTEDTSTAQLAVGQGRGEARLEWQPGDDQAHVHAWVNGGIGGDNEVRWKVYADVDE